MDLTKTDSFELAVNTRGDKNSEKIAIVLPGRLDTKDYECFNSHLGLFASKGFFAICFDPPGTWDSPGGINLFTTTNYIKAVNELIEYFGNKPTLLMGHSRGGAIANIVGTSNPSVIGIATINASLGPPSPPDPDTINGNVYLDSRDLPPGTAKTKRQKKFKVPLSYFEDGEKYNDAEILKTCTKPKLMFYSKDDEFNSPEEVREVFNSIPEPKVLYELKCNHDYRYYPEIVEEMNKVTGEFLENYLD